MYQTRQFIIFNLSEIDKIDFSQVLETSVSTLRVSVDGTKSFIKWDGSEPSFISLLATSEGPYTYEEILQILNTPEWTKPLQVPMTIL